MTQEKLEKNIIRLENRKQKAINIYNEEQFKKYLKYIAGAVVQCLILLVAGFIIMFTLWNKANPTQDYLYFIVLYSMFGSFYNLAIICATGEKIKKFHKRLALSMKLNIRQIKRYYDYMIKDEYKTFYDEM